MTYYYHYTDEQGMQAITSSGYIRESTRLDDGDDARFGTGVYLTSLPPSAGKWRIAEVCWGPNAADRMVQKGRVNYVIRVQPPPNRVKNARKGEVYLFKGDLILALFNGKAIKVPA